VAEHARWHQRHRGAVGREAELDRLTLKVDRREHDSERGHLGRSRAVGNKQRLSAGHVVGGDGEG